MTWLGKILTFVVLVGSVVWAYFTVQGFVTRTNWKNRADQYESRMKEAYAARDAEARRNQSSEDALKRLLTIEQKRTKDLTDQVSTLSTAAGKLADNVKTLQKAYDDGDGKAVILQANVDNTQKELVTVRGRNEHLENTQVALVLDAENAKKEEVKAKNAARLALAIADDNARKVEELTTRVNELRASGGSGTATVLNNINKPPPPVLPNLRGEVARVAGDQVQITIGIDSGLAVGTVLDVYRLEGGGQYLGTLKVTSALNLFPKEAIVTFTPAGNLPLDRLPVGALPKKGDEVRPPSAIAGRP